ncbi:hypothetical protein JTE90_024092 [Oedothorax gibbosus]|uniref:Uncharacterized protein n=1 Tax=Oedothorax gibbosus TaxID=931172 RepID=A0AAV6URA9_9ARAC|nr:hypothetical protein JTE90_024092 [Oedothorax gibbosus]
MAPQKHKTKSPRVTVYKRPKQQQLSRDRRSHEPSYVTNGQLEYVLKEEGIPSSKKKNILQPGRGSEKVQNCVPTFAARLKEEMSNKKIEEEGMYNAYYGFCWDDKLDAFFPSKGVHDPANKCFGILLLRLWKIRSASLS